MSRIAILSRLIPAMATVAATAPLAICPMPLSAQTQTMGDAPGVTIDAGGTLLHRAAIRTPANYSGGGLVIVEAKLSTSGEVSDARITTGPEELRRDALLSILQWHYDTQAGSPSVVRITIQYAPQTGPSASQTVMTRALVPVLGNRLGQVDPAATRTVAAVEFTGVDGRLRERIENRLAGTVGSEVSVSALSGIIRKVTEVDAHVRTMVREKGDGKSVTIEVLGPSSGIGPSQISLPNPREASMLGGIITAASPQPNVPGRINVGGNVQAAKLIQKVDPAYPPLARQARIQGTVRFNASIGRDGRIIGLQLISGHPLLVQPAADAARQWVYQPTLLNGQPTEVMTQIELAFSLVE